MKQQVLFLCLLLGLFSQCRQEEAGLRIRKNLEIDDHLKTKMWKIDYDLFQALIHKDVPTIKNMMSTSLREMSGSQTDTLAERIYNAFTAQTFRILDQYYVVGADTTRTSTLSSGEDRDHDYFIHYPAYTKETFISLFLPNGLEKDFLILAIYGKYDNQWLLDGLQFGQYNLFGKTAADYYLLAKDAYAQGHLTDAYDNIYVAGNILRPAGDFFEYRCESDFKALRDKVTNTLQTQYPMPYTLENIQSKPKILRIYPEMLQEGYFPMVLYFSTIPLENNAALKAENDSIKIEVNRLFTGISLNKKYVFYRAYNVIPDGQTPVRHFGFIDESMEKSSGAQ